MTYCTCINMCVGSSCHTNPINVQDSNYPHPCPIPCFEKEWQATSAINSVTQPVHKSVFRFAAIPPALSPGYIKGNGPGDKGPIPIVSTGVHVHRADSHFPQLLLMRMCLV